MKSYNKIKRDSLICVFLSASILLLYHSPALGLTGNEAFEKLKERLAAIDTMKGIISIAYPTGDLYSGKFQYMPPGRIHIDLSNPPGKKIISNGKRLWVYDVSTDVCGVQELYAEDEENDKELDEEEKKKKELKIKGGLENLFNGYEAILISESDKGVIIEIRNEFRKYTEIQLTLDKSFMLSSARFTDKEGIRFVMKITDLKFGEKPIPGLFNFDVPANAQVVKNPLDIR